MVYVLCYEVKGEMAHVYRACAEDVSLFQQSSHHDSNV